MGPRLMKTPKPFSQPISRSDTTSGRESYREQFSSSPVKLSKTRVTSRTRTKKEVIMILILTQRKPRQILSANSSSFLTPPKFLLPRHLNLVFFLMQHSLEHFLCIQNVNFSILDVHCDKNLLLTFL